MRKISYLFLGLLVLGTLEVQASALTDLEAYWGLSPLREKLQHPLEGIREKKELLEVSVWYENASITRGALPDRELYCRFLHSFTYGKNIPRSERTELPPTRAFRMFPNAKEIQFSFFAILHRNRPSPPAWDEKPSDASDEEKDAKTSESKLRVVWTREEKLAPYLNLHVSRQEWNTVSQVLKLRPYYAFSEFNKEVCDSLFRLMPRMRSNFSSLDASLKNP